MSTNLEASQWQKEGLGVNLNANTRSKTYRTVGAINTTIDPAVNANLTISYDTEGGMFNTPDWMGETVFSLTVTNLFKKDVEVTSIDGNGDVIEARRNYPSLLEARGRMLTFIVSKAF